MKNIPSSPSSYSAKCTIPLHKSVGKISARSTVAFRSPFVILTAVPKIHSKRLPILVRPDRAGTRGVTNRRHRRKGALGESPLLHPITPPMTTFRSSVDGTPSAFGNQLFRGFPSFRAPQGGSIVCRKCIKIRSSRELYRNRCQSECLNHLLSRISEELLTYTKARAQDYKADAHNLTTALRLPFSALPGTRQFEGW